MASIKHTRFVDEDEWRLIYLHNTDSQNSLRQLLYKGSWYFTIPLVTYISPSLSIHNHFEKVMIAPYKDADKDSNNLIKIIEQCGVNDARNKVHISQIPLIIKNIESNHSKSDNNSEVLL